MALPVFSVAVESLNPFRTGAPRLLFQADVAGAGPVVRSGDATPDGKRLVFVKRERSDVKPATQTEVVLNWSEDLKRRVH